MVGRYEKSLDGYRTIAVLLVIIHHWMPLFFRGSLLPTGTVGVTMFFVLSGFLITGILVRGKESNHSAIAVFKNFYIRRSLRIFPIYYLYVFMLFVLVGFDSTKLFLSCITYTSNFHTFCINNWGYFTAHLWSLAVEEQFYLIWPFILLFSNRNTKTLLYGFLLLGILSRVILHLLYPGNEFNVVLTPTCFDCFAIGGLLAIHTKEASIEEKLRSYHVLRILSVISFLLFVGELAFKTTTIEITQRLYISIISVWLIHLLYNRDKSILKTVLSFSPMVYLGKISYGIYLYHLAIIPLYNYIQQVLYAHHLFIPFTHYTLLPWLGGLKQNIFYALLLLFISSASWYLIEKPINNLKSRFNL